ncbi:hypothetical protein SPAN111604_09995 [Sphingomonas antarctica]|uniref:PEPxxWA-CTERM sorting domain-containing protein n=1 Tax=Sphingomonas antarctica TaxID=2040274 RepID=UPI0039EC1D14
MMRKIAALAVLMMPVPAFAADFSFVRYDGSDRPFTFNIATSPTPDFSSAKTFEIDGVSTHETGQFGQPLVYDADYTFYSDADGGGFLNGFVAYYSAQLFGGTTAAPTFYNGVFDLSDFGGGPPVGTLTITNGATLPTGGVPEPASWALMLAGFGAAGVALRRRPRHLALSA